MTEYEIGRIIVNWAARIHDFSDALMKEGISRILNGRIK
jgi:predicted GNAT family N-acyltransferase